MGDEMRGYLGTVVILAVFFLTMGVWRQALIETEKAKTQQTIQGKCVIKKVVPLTWTNSCLVGDRMDTYLMLPNKKMQFHRCKYLGEVGDIVPCTYAIKKEK